MCIECVHEENFTDEYLRNAFLPVACEALTPSTVQRSDSGDRWEQGACGCRMRPGPRCPRPRCRLPRL
jgi:hypothetical protein